MIDFYESRGADGTLFSSTMKTTDPAAAPDSGGDRHVPADELRVILNSIPGFVWSLRADGELHHLNSKVIAYTGRSLEDLREPKWREVMHPDDIEPFVSAWTAAMRSRTPIEVEFRLRRADGIFRWFRTTGTPVVNEFGVISGWYGVDIDIEDKKNVDEALRHAQSQLARSAQLAIAGELAASMADAINQPLVAVAANGVACQRWLSQSPPDLTRALSTVDRIVEDCTAVAHVAKRIRGIVTQSAPVNVPLNINDSIVTVLGLHDFEIQERGITVSMVLERELPPIYADVTLIQQVLVNLIRNAMDAMQSQLEGPRLLTIHSRCQQAMIVVEIADSGIGFSDDARLCEAFYTTKTDGLGLGLAIAKSIVGSYSGKLWGLHNEPTGSIFGFNLPVEPGTAGVTSTGDLEFHS